MGKIGRLVRDTFQKDFLPPFVGTFLAVLGVPATVVTLVGGHFSFATAIGLVFFSLTVTIIIHRHHWKSHSPGPGLINERKMLRCPCDQQLAQKAATLARSEFGRNTIPPVSYEPLRGRNRFILTCLVGADGGFLGYFDVFPVKKSFAELFLQGRVSEKDLTPENMLGTSGMRRSKYLYVGGVAAADADQPVNGSILVWGLLKYLEHYYRDSGAYIFTSAASLQGEKLLRNLNIPVASDKTARKDRQTVYGARLTAELLSQLLSSVPDYTLLCSLEWEREKTSIQVRPTPRRPFSSRRKRRQIAV